MGEGKKKAGIREDERKTEGWIREKKIVEKWDEKEEYADERGRLRPLYNKLTFLTLFN